MQDHVTHHRAQILVYLNLNEIQPQNIWVVTRSNLYINKDINMKRALFLFAY
jgi:hypothetical protein